MKFNILSVRNSSLILLFTAMVISIIAISPVHAATPTTNPWLEVVPNTMTINTPKIFNVQVYLRDLDADWNLIGTQFVLTYDGTILEATNVFIGPFMSDPAWAIHSTFPISDIETGKVTYGELVLPNENNGQWDLPQFPNGEGLLATVTFKVISYKPNVSFDISAESLFGEYFLDKNFDYIPYANSKSCSFTYAPMTFTWQPSSPSSGEVTQFTAPELTGYNAIYGWNFGDGTQTNTTNPTINHIYSLVGTHDATLTLYINDLNIAIDAVQPITISNNLPITFDVTTDVGSTHFRGEIAEFNILTSYFGNPTDATTIKAVLYHNGLAINDLSNSVQAIATGLYRIPYSIPGNLETGTYTLVVTAEYYNIAGTSLKAFVISPTLTSSVATIQGIQNGVATISTDTQAIKVNLAAINATITGLITNSKGETLAKIDTAIGPLTTSLNSINATVTSVKGNTVTISTSLGEITTKVNETQSTATNALYITAILSLMAVILAAAILMFIGMRARVAH